MKMKRLSTLGLPCAVSSAEGSVMSARLIRFLVPAVLIALVSVGLPGVCSSDGGGRGGTGYTEAVISSGGGLPETSLAVVATTNIHTQVLTKSHGSEIAGLGIGQAAVWNFTVHAFADVVGHVNPEGFTVTAVDMGRQGETIRIRVSKAGTVGTVSRSAVSPQAASYGLAVNDGDTIKVIVDYPNGFVLGNTGSAYAIHWAMQNSGWIAP
jgi:hypothetical protein